MGFYEPTYVDGVLQIDEAVLEEGTQKWRETIVGFFLDKKLLYFLVKCHILNKWKLRGSVIIAQDGDLHYFELTSEEDHREILDAG